MNEKANKRREWIKTLAIIFLVILLVLTFFSNTIMNYSLPEVAAQYIQPGNITAKIRGYGTIESGDPYSVKIEGVRKVESVEVRQGDTVEKGQVLCVFSGEDSEELEAAKDELAMAEAEFEMALLTGTVDSTIMNSAGSTDSMQNYKNKIIAVKNEITVAEAESDAAEAKVKEWKDKVDAITLQITLTNTGIVDTTNEQTAYNNAKTAMENARFALTEAQNKLQTIEAQISQQMSVSSGDAVALEALEQQKQEANQQLIDAQAAFDTASLNCEKAQKVLDDKKATGNTDASIANLERQLALLQVEQNNAQKVLDQKTEVLTAKQAQLDELVKNISDEINLGNLNDKVNKAKKKVKELEALTEGSEVIAPISGTISSVNVKSGLDTPEDGIVFTMQPEGDGYTLSFSVTTEQAKKVNVGDVAEVVNSWRYDDMKIVLSSIRPDTANPGQNRILVFNVSGENVVPNQSVNVAIPQRAGGYYEMVVPNSAIREDNNGKFILIVESKSSPIGTRYIARRADVDVVASDDTQSAITGTVSGYEFVITTSTKPVEAGQYVRLPE
ncbi:MAG: HlyD family efflux transporter periplasmic adaptor subunit [Lachnospiraceae bacterium]|nr:HlyD family efflux transporter periplasmic adaptor subunit [Lachnospiraceae bacterium]